MSSSTRRGSDRKRVVLSPEALEDRTVPAGNVNAYVSGGVLNVTGDAADNRVWVMGLGNGSALIAPIDNTTINGSHAPQILGGIAFAYNIQLGDGNDFLYVTNTSGGISVFANLANGNDGLAMDLAKHTGQTILATGAGNDVITMGMGKLPGLTTFDVGSGNNRVNVAGTEFGAVAFRGGIGADSLGLLGVNFRSVPATSGFERVYSTMTPTANHDSTTVQHGTTKTIDVSANDTAPGNTLNKASIKITKQPEHGTVNVNGDGTVTYTADSSTAGFDSFKYTILNSSGAESNAATVSLVLTPVHTTPDTTGPVPTISTTAGNTTNLATIPFTVTFNEDVTGFDLTDVSVTNGTASNFVAVDARTFTFNVVPTADGAVTVSLAAGAAKDAKNNDSSAATKTITSDRAAPTATITTPTNPTNAASIPVTVTFSENVTGFEASDLNVAGGTVSGFTAVNASTYTFNVAPTGTGTGQITINVAAGVATDAAGNANTAATQLTITSDQTAPSVTIATTASDPTNLATIPFTAQFSKAVTGFVAGDVTVTGGTISNFVAVDGDTYTFDITPTADGPVTVGIAAGVATDTSGNANTAATPITVNSDRTEPTATVSSTVSGTTSTNPIPFTVTFSEDVTVFTAGDILVTNGAVTGFTAVDAKTYNFSVVPNASGDVGVTVPAAAAKDAATNGNMVSNTLTVAFSGSVVTSTITTTATDPTNLAAIPMTVTFSEDVTGFDETDLSLINGTASNFVAVDGSTYTFDLIPTSDGPVTVDVPAGAATGTSGNPTSASNFVIASDRTGPTAMITTTATDPTKLAVIPFTVTFDEDVTGFDETDLMVNNGTASNFVAVDGSTYTFDVTPTADGLVSVDIAAGVVSDTAGNDSPAATFSINSDRTAPTATVTTTESDPTTTNPIPFTVAFSEDVTGFDAADLTVTNGTVSNFIAVDGKTYTFNVNPSASNVTIDVSVAADAAQDAATNGNTASTTATITFNGTIVIPTITTTATDPTKLSPIPFTVAFDEDVTGFDLTDIGVTNGTAGNFATVDAKTYTFDVTPTADGPVVVDLAAGAATGSVSSGSTRAVQFTITSDTTAPTATIATTVSSPTNLSPIPFTITFNEDVTGFEFGDITVVNGTASNFVAVDARTYTFDVNPSSDGDVTVNVSAGAATDAAGNANPVATPVTIIADSSAPTVAITTTASNPTAASTIPVTVTFSENVTGFDIGDIVINNGAASNFVAVNGTTYTFNLTPAADGAITVNIAAAVASDSSGNANIAATEFTITSIRTDAGMTNTLPDVNAAEWQALGSQGLKVWDVQTGTGTAVTSGSTITVFYSGWLLNGTVFDSARTTGSPATFPLSNLIAGWKQGLLGMQPGGIRRLYIPAALAYGAAGQGSVPPNADLVFEIKLVSTT